MSLRKDWVVLLLLLHLSVHGNQGLQCHQCTGVTDPHYCSLVVHCAADEECHTEKVIGKDSIVFYNTGCQKIQLCQLAANGKRSDLHVCEGCCGTDLCNSELCPAGNRSTASSSCQDEPYVDCKLADDTHSICADRTLAAVKYCQKYCGYCSADGSTLPPPTGTTADTCKDSGDVDCKLMNDSLHICAKKDSPPTLFNCPNFCGICTPSSGSMSTPVTHVTVAAITTAGSTTNSSCRDEPFIDCKLADDTHSICTQRTLAAVKYCQKYCGYCSADGSTLPPPTGTTVDTCKDSGDIDCKLMNDSLHICALKDSPPTLFHCLSFCGICTSSGGGVSAPVTFSKTTMARTTTGSTARSSCKDEPYIDCKLADDTHSICTERTLAAVKYCQKYCGYCSADGSTLPPPTGTTVDTCIDSGDVDCKLMNDSLHICAKKNSPPTILYCPKFCGICTPGGDKVMNSTSPQVTTVPVTIVPVTTVLVTTVPVVTVSVTTVPVATLPVTTVPVTTAPVATVPVVTVPVSTVPVATQSKAKMTTQLPTTKAITRQPTVKVTVPGTTLAASTGPPPKTLPPIATTCAVCAGPHFLCEKLYAPTTCPPPNNYCINTITNHKNGTRSVDRACGSFDTCYHEWFLGSSDNDKCRKYNSNDEQRLDFQCTFCCIKDNCNNPLHPADNTLYKPV